MSKIKVFPIPYAGASVNVYYGWNKLLPQNFELCLVELAGRGGRYNDPFYTSVDEAALDIAKRINAQINDDEYVLFGHSMGALLAYEVYYKLLELRSRAPKHLFISGKKAPQVGKAEGKIRHINDVDFIKMVDKFGGLPKEFYQEEVLEMFLPILRADFCMLDEYLYHKKNEKVTCDISIMYGKDDSSTLLNEVEPWRNVCEGKSKFYEFEGNHFFINDYPDLVVECIVNTLS